MVTEIIIKNIFFLQYAHTLRPEMLYRRQSPIARVLDMFRGMTSANPQPEQVNQKRRMVSIDFVCLR